VTADVVDGDVGAGEGAGDGAGEGTGTDAIVGDGLAGAASLLQATAIAVQTASAKTRNGIMATSGGRLQL
jgi:hypothetical protein